MKYNEMHFTYLHYHLTLLINFREYISLGGTGGSLEADHLHLQLHLHIHLPYMVHIYMYHLQHTRQ